MRILSLNPAKSSFPHFSRSHEMLRFSVKLWYFLRRASSSVTIVCNPLCKIFRLSVFLALKFRALVVLFPNPWLSNWFSTVLNTTWSDRISWEKLRDCSGAPAYALYTFHTSVPTPRKSPIEKPKLMLAVALGKPTLTYQLHSGS